TAQRRHNFTVQRLPEVESGVEENQTIDALKDNSRTPPPDQAAFRIDYPAWLSRLPRRNRAIAVDMATGEGTRDLARKHQLSQGRISQLRRELHSDWRRFHGEIEGPPIKPTSTGGMVMSSRLWNHTQVLALLQAAKHSPEDDAPRLVLADWLEEHGEGERAEFIRAQIRLAPGTNVLSQAERHRLRRRADELLECNGGCWLGSLWRFWMA